jgi:hypothetical protein
MLENRMDEKVVLNFINNFKAGRYGAVRLKPIPENDPGLYQKGAI